MRALRLVGAGLVAAVVVAGVVLVTIRTTDGADPVTINLSRRLQAEVTAAGIFEHLRALQEIADRNRSTRAAGTPGYDDSAQYVAGRLREAGFDVTFDEFVFPAYSEETPPVLRLPRGDRLRVGRDFVTLLYSPSGTASGPVTPVDFESSTSGCDDSDFAGFTGGIALVARGTCFYRDQAATAEAAGAAGLLIAQPSERGVIRGTLTTDAQVSIPVLAVSDSVAAELSGSRARMEVNSTTRERTIANVIGETGSGADVLMVGGHLDSVLGGPGLNDNGSGVATILEVAQAVADESIGRRIRFAFWGAEEYGLLGSIHYVRTLTSAERDEISAYLNFDMLGSPNGVRFIYDDADAIRTLFESHFESRDLSWAEIELEGRSDHALFAEVGIPVGGLFSGADAVKTESEAERFGGRAGSAHDPCYHLACDDLGNVDRTILSQMAEAVAGVVGRLLSRES